MECSFRFRNRETPTGIDPLIRNKLLRERIEYAQGGVVVAEKSKAGASERGRNLSYLIFGAA